MLLEAIQDLRLEIRLQGDRIVAIAQDILDAVAAEKTAVDSIVVYLKNLIENNVITTEQGQAIIDAINANKTELEQAIQANT